MSMIPKSMPSDLIRGWGRFPAFAKPASAGEARSDKIMLKQKNTTPKSHEAKTHKLT